MTESIDQKVARLIALKAEAYYLQGRGKVEHALLAHAEFEAALRTELSATAVHGEAVQQDQRKLNGLTLAVWACSKPAGSATPEQMRELLAQCVPYLRAAAPQPAPPEQPMSGRAAYEGMRESMLHWQGRALEAEASNKQLVRALREEVERPTFIGEPVIQPAQPISGEEVTDAEVDAAFRGTGWLGRKEDLRYVLAKFLSGRAATSTKLVQSFELRVCPRHDYAIAGENGCAYCNQENTDKPIAPPLQDAPQPLIAADLLHLWETLYDHGTGKHKGAVSLAQRQKAFEILNLMGAGSTPSPSAAVPKPPSAAMPPPPPFIQPTNPPKGTHL